MFPHVLGWDDLPDLYWADLASLASDSFVFSRPLLQVQDLPNFVFVFVPILYFCIFLALCCSATGAEHSKWRQQSTTKEKYFGLNFLTWSAPRLSVIISSTVLWPSSLSLISLCAPLTPSPRKQRCLLSSPYSQLLHKNGKNIVLFFYRRSLYQAQTAPRKRSKFPFGMELRPISFWCPLGQGIFLVVFVFWVFFHVCNSTAANIIIISLIPNWLVCFPCDRIDMLIHIIISKYLS